MDKISEIKPVLKQITTREEYVNTFIRLRLQVGWGGCEIDGDFYLAQGNGKGLWAGYVGEELMCTFSFLEFPDINTVYFGSYITDEKFRGKGLTYPLFKEKYEELKAQGFRFIFTTEDKNISLYKKSFRVEPTGKIDFFKMKSGDFVFKNLPQNCLFKGSEVPFDDLAAYDKSICNFDRSRSLRLLQTHPEVICRVFVEAGSIKGYGALKRSTNGFRILPLLADNLEIARTLIEAMVENVPKEEDVFIYSPNPTHSTELKEMGFCSFFVINIMGNHPNNFDKIYGIYAIDAGL